jgi:hypothetical protein
MTFPALAYRSAPDIDSKQLATVERKKIEKGFTFLGLLLLRNEVIEILI